MAYIDEAKMDDNVAPFFELTVKQHDHPHSIRLKNRILANFSEFTTHKVGRDVFLAFDKDLSPALHKVYDKFMMMKPNKHCMKGHVQT